MNDLLVHCVMSLISDNFYICFLISPTDLFRLKCQPAFGVIGQTTNINCDIEAETVSTVNTVVITKIGETEPCFTFNRRDGRVISDPRFQHKNVPSLQLENTMISDEGDYNYFIRTSHGSEDIRFTINVTGKSKMSWCSHDLTTTESKLHL